jgi:hypothetical protein
MKWICKKKYMNRRNEGRSKKEGLKSGYRHKRATYGSMVQKKLWLCHETFYPDRNVDEQCYLRHMAKYCPKYRLLCFLCDI